MDRGLPLSIVALERMMGTRGRRQFGWRPHASGEVIPKRANRATAVEVRGVRLLNAIKDGNRRSIGE